MPQSDRQATPRRRLPIGTEIQPSGGVHFRVWAARGEVRSPSSCASPVPTSHWSGFHWKPKATATSPVSRQPPRPAAAMAFAWTTTSSSFRTRRRAGSPTARTDCRKSSIPRPSSGTIKHWRGVPTGGPGDLRIAPRHVHARGNLRRGDREVAVARRVGVTMVEVMPVAEFAGEFGWGYDGVEPVRADPAVRHARRFSPLCRRSASPGPGRDARRGLQPLRPGGQLPGAVFRRLPVAAPRNRLGRRDQFRRQELCSGARVLLGQRRLLDRRVSRRRSAAGRRACDHRRLAGAHSGGHRPSRAQGGRRPAIAGDRRERTPAVLRHAARRAGRLRAGRRLERRLSPCRPAWPPPGTPSTTLATIAARRRSSSRWSSGATCTKDNGTRGSSEFRGTPGLDLDGAQFVTFLQNHDQVGNSPWQLPPAQLDLARAGIGR